MDSKQIRSSFEQNAARVREFFGRLRLKGERPRKKKWRRWLGFAAASCFLAAVSLLLYCWSLSVQIDKRFSGRRWSIPSKVYSDTTILFPGQEINPSLFHEKLRRLGYREVSHPPARKGEMQVSASEIRLCLNDLNVPGREREGFPATLRMWRGRIESIIRADTSESVPILELEPEEITLFFGSERERRRLVSIDQVPQHLVYAVMAAEDRRFYEHHGLDPRGIARAFLTNMRHGEIRQGGSTITQQLAKCYFLTPKRTISRKFTELIMSLLIETKYEKDEIMEIYLNEIYLGQKGSVSINGVAEASQFYFAKPVAELSLAEAATIAALIKAPNAYSPYINEENCRKRRNAVLHSMYRNGWISEEEFHSTSLVPVTTSGYAVYEKKAPYFIDYLSEQLNALYSPEALSSLGLSIHTTLDTQVQMAAEDALQKVLVNLEESNPALKRAEPQKSLQGAVIVMQPKTGYILALVGGRDYGASQFNRITRARRQPGSAFKPFVYLSALDRFTPASLVSNQPKTYVVNKTVWEPQNFTPVPEPEVILSTALAQSINVATVDLAMKVGLEHVVRTASDFGFSTPMKPYPSLSLGAFEVIPLELARAYCAFAADGVLPYPLSLKEVVDESGDVLERRHMTIDRVISPQKAYIMVSMLEDVVNRGTARPLRRSGISFPVAGKTGTTNDFRDAWFVGFTPDILALVWIGFDDEESIYATGSTAALPVWAEIMKSIPQHVSGSWFRMPSGLVRKAICPQTGLLANRYACPDPTEEVFLKGGEPEHPCPVHTRINRLRQIIDEGRNAINNL